MTDSDVKKLVTQKLRGTLKRNRGSLQFRNAIKNFQNFHFQRTIFFKKLYKLFLFINASVIAKFRKDTQRNSNVRVCFGNYGNCPYPQNDNRLYFNVK